MRITGGSSPEEMVAAFLLAEIESDRWGEDFVLPLLKRNGWPESLVRTPNLADRGANVQRAQLLAEYRGWENNLLMCPEFPRDVDWRKAELDPADVGQVLGARFPTWDTLSGGSRRVADCVSVARHGPLPKLPHGELREGIAEAVARSYWLAHRYRSGDELPPPILVTPRVHHPIVAIEGHTRLIAWSLADRADPLTVILGISDQLNGWCRF